MVLTSLAAAVGCVRERREEEGDVVVLAGVGEEEGDLGLAAKASVSSPRPSQGGPSHASLGDSHECGAVMAGQQLDSRSSTDSGRTHLNKGVESLHTPVREVRRGVERHLVRARRKLRPGLEEVGDAAVGVGRAVSASARR